MTQPALNMDQIGALFEERQRYESWLSTLEAKRPNTPAHIYDRVHADYTARLQRVLEQLASHRTVLQEMERSLMDRLTSLDIDESKNRDEAAEAELRSLVGELTPDRHEEVVNRTSAALGSIADERARVAEELARLRAVLEASAPAAPRSGGEPAAEATPSAERATTPTPGQTRRVTATPVAAPTPAQVAAAAPAKPNEATPRAAGPFDDLEFLKTMIDPRTNSGEGVAVASGAGAGSGAAAGGAQAGSGSGSHPAAGGSGTPSEAIPAQAAASMPSVGRAIEEQPLPREGGVDQVKTLKCQECGTLNYPTEWYCERCGAELAAL